MTIALQLAQYVNNVRYEDLPPQAIEHAKMIIASTFASAAPGTVIGSAAIMRDLAKEHGGAPDASVWFDGAKLPLTEVVRVNAMLSDAAASDDSDMRNIAHIGTIATSVSLAVAEKTGASGKDVLAAIAAAYEASGRIGEAINPGEGGFHACVITVFAGAVAAGRLLGLTDEQLAHAICLSATSIGGLAMSTNSWGREYHAGFAAVSGLTGALAAQKGYAGDLTILEAPRGFLKSFHSKVEPETLIAGLGEEWDINTHLMIKLRPGAHPLSAAVEAAINAASEGNVNPDEVAAIKVSGPRMRTQIGHRHPTDLVGAIHSLPYYLAAATADKDFTWVHATMEKIVDPTIGSLQDLVEVDPNPPAVDYTWGWGATVVIEMKDGRSYRSTVNAPIGSGPRGIEWSDVDHKYRTLMPESGIAPDRMAQALDAIKNLDQAKDVRSLIGLII
ncbi:MAG TPA: MmgE/PrpD family protein [Dehalococcoidia bacterium]|nr:MmgE/PrpD family protein [Dehalococcoidia bacterium]